MMSESPYNFAFGNPVTFNDPLGDRPREVMLDLERYGGGGGSAAMYDWSDNWMQGFGPHQYGQHRIGPGSGNYWGDGMGYSDWSPNGGSQMYRDGLSAGLVDIGGKLYGFDKSGNRVKAEERNGRLGYWEGYTDTEWEYFIDGNGNLRRTGTPVIGQRFVAQEGGPGEKRIGPERGAESGLGPATFWDKLSGTREVNGWEVDQNGNFTGNPAPLGGAVIFSPGGGIAAYGKLRQITKGWKGVIQAHHIVEVRHLKALGLSIIEAPSVILSRANHTQITNTLQTLLPTGFTYTRAQIMAAYKQAYSAYPRWIEAASKYLGY